MTIIFTKESKKENKWNENIIARKKASQRRETKALFTLIRTQSDAAGW